MSCIRRSVFGAWPFSVSISTNQRSVNVVFPRDKLPIFQILLKYPKDLLTLKDLVEKGEDINDLSVAREKKTK
jgi:hypothetical protein